MALWDWLISGKERKDFQSHRPSVSGACPGRPPWHQQFLTPHRDGPIPPRAGHDLVAPRATEVDPAGPALCRQMPTPLVLTRRACSPTSAAARGLSHGSVTDRRTSTEEPLWDRFLQKDVWE